MESKYEYSRFNYSILLSHITIKFFPTLFVIIHKPKMNINHSRFYYDRDINYLYEVNNLECPFVFKNIDIMISVNDQRIMVFPDYTICVKNGEYEETIRNHVLVPNIHFPGSYTVLYNYIYVEEDRILGDLIRYYPHQHKNIHGYVVEEARNKMIKRLTQNSPINQEIKIENNSSINGESLIPPHLIRQ